MLGTLSVVGLAVLAVLVWMFLRRHRHDQIAEMVEKRRAGSKIVSEAEYVEGIERIPVALALAGDTIYYENPDLQASFDLSSIDEIEYDDELSTGKSVQAGCTALRLRSHGRAIEFVLPTPVSDKWKALIPPHRVGESAAAV